MTERPSCPECGSPVPDGAPGGACPGCLLAAGLDDADRTGLPTHDALEAAFPSLEIGELLGRGGMGAVFEARQKTLDRRVALKVLPQQEPARELAFAVHFEREARALARLDHPNIVRVYEFGESGGLHYLLMEFVDGVNLRDVMEGGDMTPRQALTIIPKVCDALQYAHDQGVVHRDIKPENVLLSKDGAVKVADFGLAKLAARASGPDATLTRAGQVMGTLHYMAPEQIESPSSVDHRADIYSLGVVFYELLTGDLPLGRFDPPSERVRVDARLDAVVLRALEKKRERRYQKVSEVKTAVSEISDPGDGAAAAVARRPRTPRHAPDRDSPGHDRSRRRYSLRAVLAAVAVPITVVVTLAVAFLVHADTNDIQYSYPWAGLVSGVGMFGAVVLALAALPATRRGTGKKGRWMAVCTLVFALVAVPIVFWASFYLLDVSGVRRLQPTAQSQRRPTPRDFPPGTFAFQKYPVHDDPEFALTDGGGTYPIPAATGQTLKARLTHLLGSAARLERSESVEIDSARELVTAADLDRVKALSPAQFDEAVASGSLGLAFLAPGTLPEPIENFRIVAAHVEGSLAQVGTWDTTRRMDGCKGLATARSNERELTFAFHGESRRGVLLTVKPIGWTRVRGVAPTTATASDRVRPSEVRLFNWAGTEFSRMGNAHASRAADAGELLQALAHRVSKAEGGRLSEDEALELSKPSVARRVRTILETELPADWDWTDVLEGGSGLPLTLAWSETDGDADERLPAELALAYITEVHFDRDERRARIIAQGPRTEFEYWIASENGRWYFDSGTTVIRPRLLEEEDR